MKPDLSSLKNIAQGLVRPNEGQATPKTGDMPAIDRITPDSKHDSSPTLQNGNPATLLQQSIDSRAVQFSQAYDRAENNLKAIRKSLDILTQWHRIENEQNLAVNPDKMIEQAQVQGINLLKGDAITVDNDLILYGEDLTDASNRDEETMLALKERIERFLNHAKGQQQFIHDSLSVLLANHEATNQRTDLNDEGAHLLALQIKQDLQGSNIQNALAAEAKQAILSLY